MNQNISCMLSIELLHYHGPSTAGGVLVLVMTSRDVRANSTASRFWCSQRLVWSLIVNGSFLHKLLLFLWELVPTDDPRIGKSYFLYLTIESIAKLFLNGRGAWTSCRVSYHQYILKAWVKHVVFPYKYCMLLHGSAVRNRLFCLWILTQIRIHDKNTIIIEIDCPVDLREHTSKFIICIDANWSCPISCSNSSGALDQNKRCLFWI